MEQLLQILQFLGVALWPGGLIAIVLGFIAAAITIFVKNSLERKQALPGAKDRIESTSADSMSSPEVSYPSEQVGKLVEEIDALRKEIAELRSHQQFGVLQQRLDMTEVLSVAQMYSDTNFAHTTKIS